jgi:uncharacterized protein YhfF
MILGVDLMDSVRNPTIEAYWQSFLQTLPPEFGEIPERYEAWGFGNTPEMADELGDLVLRGIKTATASLVWSFEAEDEPITEVGDYSIVLDSEGEPLCIIQATAIDIHPYNEVDEEQAYLEGEGDRSLRYWREVHWKFFSEECEKIDRTPDERMLVVCERFALVHV